MGESPYGGGEEDRLEREIDLSKATQQVHGGLRSRTQVLFVAVSLLPPPPRRTRHTPETVSLGPAEQPRADWIK